MSPDNETSQPVLSLGLRQGNSFGNDLLQLNRPSFASLNNLEVTTFETERTVIFVCSELDETTGRVDLAAALRAGLFQIAEQSSQKMIEFSPAEESERVGRMEVPPKPSPKHRQSRIGLGIDSTAQIWKDTLQPGETYLLRFSADGGEAWCAYKDSPDRSLAVRREADFVRFTVHDDPAPPTFSAVFGVEPSICHCSGDPSFKFVAEITSSVEEPVTVNTTSTPFGGELNCVEQLVYCVDAETGEEVEFPAQFGCFDEDPSPDFPDDDKFVEVVPGNTWWFEYTLDRLSNSTLGGLESLESGRKYKVGLSQQARAGFGCWMLGSKEDLLRGTLEEKKKRWRAGLRGRGNISVKQQNGPVDFEVID